MKTLGILKYLFLASILGLVIGGGTYAWRALSGQRTIDQLIRENTELQQAVERLTAETQIGYAKVLDRQERDGRVHTRLLFAETRPNDPLDPVFKEEFEVPGEVVHFDALIVKFGHQWVRDGRARALYLWRRIYSDGMAPDQGRVIHAPGTEPARYEALCRRLSVEDRRLFWDQIWGLANDPAALEHLGIQAVYGNVVYHKLQPGLIYVFKIDAVGTLYPEVVPDL